MTSWAPLATTYGDTLEYPCGLNDRPIVLAPGKATLPFTVTVSILMVHASASTNFRESPSTHVEEQRCAAPAAWVILAGTPITNERTAKVSDYPNSSAGGAGSVRYINPDSLNNNPAFTNVVVVEGNVKTVHIGGQDALNASGEIVGKGDIVAQTKQILTNVRAALEAGSARPEHIIKWNIYVVEGQSLQAGFGAFENAWPQTPNPPAITGVFVSGLAHPDFLVEMDAVAVVPQ